MLLAPTSCATLPNPRNVTIILAKAWSNKMKVAAIDVDWRSIYRIVEWIERSLVIKEKHLRH